MARPRILRLDDGHVILKNFTPERSKQLEALILGEVKIEPGTQVRIEKQILKVVSPDDLTENAIGYYFDKDTKQYMIMIIKYNPEFKTCLVNKIEPAGDFKALAINSFKVKCIDLNLI